jgi:hypothetical protein
VLRNTFRIKEPDRFQKVASGVQAWILALATLGAGLWAIFTYTALSQRLRSTLELEDLERRNNLRGILELKLDLSQETDDTGRRFIHALVIAENKGTKDMIVEMDAMEPLSAFGLLFDEPKREGRTQITPKLITSGGFFGGGLDAQKNEQPLPQQTIRAGETYRFHGLLKVESSGLYLVVFDTPVHPEDDLPGPKAAAHWTATNYIAIR